MSGKVPPSSKAREKRARKAYSDFTGHEVDAIEYIEMPEVKEAWALGELTGVMYRAVRDGEEEFYVHEFNEKSSPILAVSPCGKQLVILGGNYIVKDTGINDL